MSDGARPLRVAVAFPGDGMDPSAWSGTPLGIFEGLRAAGADPVALRAAPSDAATRRTLQLLAVPRLRASDVRVGGVRFALGEAKGAARLGMAWSRWCSRVGQRRLDGMGEVDAVVQVGTSYRLRHPRLVTFEDMTVRQVLGRPYFSWENVTQRVVARRIALQTEVYDAAHACCVATPWVRSSVVGDYRIDPAKVHAVGIGRNHEPVATTRDWSTPRFLFVGKDWVDKNGPSLLAAFREVRAAVPDATLDVVGHHPLIDVEGVTGHGFLRRDVAEQRERMTSLFAAATCLVVPTSFEPAGIVYVEAAAAGLPCIGTDQGGASDLIGSGGIAVDPTDVSSIVQAMLSMCVPDEARKRGEAALRRAPLFTWTSVAQRLLQTAGLQLRREEHWNDLFDGVGVENPERRDGNVTR